MSFLRRVVERVERAIATVPFWSRWIEQRES